jgi:hypothetical protein
MNHHAFGIDIGSLQMGLLKTETAGINRGQIGIVVKRVNLLQNLKDLIPVQNTGQSLFLLGFEVFKYRPLFLQDMDKKEL